MTGFSNEKKCSRSSIAGGSARSRRLSLRTLGNGAPRWCGWRRGQLRRLGSTALVPKHTIEAHGPAVRDVEVLGDPEATGAEGQAPNRGQPVSIPAGCQCLGALVTWRPVPREIGSKNRASSRRETRQNHAWQ